MGVWCTVEFHLAGGVVVESEITDETAKDMLSEQGRYVFATSDLSDREKVVRMVSTKIAFAMEKGKGEFVVWGKDHRFWLMPNVNILAAAVIEPDGKARRMGFGPLDESVKLRVVK